MALFSELRRKASYFFRHPLVGLGVALTLIGSSAAEVAEPLFSGELKLDLGAEHGVLLFGLAHGMKSLLEFFEGIEKLGQVEALTAGLPEDPQEPGKTD